MNPGDQYDSGIERAYANRIEAAAKAEVVFVGAGVGLWAALQLARSSRLKIAVLDNGPLDLLTHIGNTGLSRRPLMDQGMERIGGRTSVWGLQASRPSMPELAQWPYSMEGLNSRFTRIEVEMGVPERIPFSNLILEERILTRISRRFPDALCRPAPVAMNAAGHRWSSLDYLDEAQSLGVVVVPRAEIARLVVQDDRVTEVYGRWLNGAFCLHPEVVMVATGVERALPLLRSVAGSNVTLETADHIRIDSHGVLPPDCFGGEPPERLGIAMLIMEMRSSLGIPFHLEVKVGPRCLWRSAMPSGDNLHSKDGDSRDIWVQVQCVSSMHDRLAQMDLLNIGATVQFPPVISSRDMRLTQELLAVMSSVSGELGLHDPTYHLRPLTKNYHLYGAFRVGTTLTEFFRWKDVGNLWILPPTGFVNTDDNANPTLKSMVLAEYAVEDVIARLKLEAQRHAA